MGWFPLPRLPGWRHHPAPVQIGQAPRPLLSRTSSRRWPIFAARRFVLDGEIVIPVGRPPVVRRPAAADSPGGQPGPRRCARRASGAGSWSSTSWPTSGGRRWRATRWRGVGRDWSVRQAVLSAPRPASCSRPRPDARHGPRLASGRSGWRSRRCRRQAPGPALSDRDRDGMVKVKRQRTADCVVGGFRYASKGAVVGSLLLGLYDDGRPASSRGILLGLVRGRARRSSPRSSRSWPSLRDSPGGLRAGPVAGARERSSEWSRSGRRSWSRSPTIM